MQIIGKVNRETRAVVRKGRIVTDKFYTKKRIYLTVCNEIGNEKTMKAK